MLLFLKCWITHTALCTNANAEKNPFKEVKISLPNEIIQACIKVKSTMDITVRGNRVRQIL